MLGFTPFPMMMLPKNAVDALSESTVMSATAKLTSTGGTSPAPNKTIDRGRPKKRTTSSMTIVTVSVVAKRSSRAIACCSSSAMMTSPDRVSLRSGAYEVGFSPSISACTRSMMRPAVLGSLPTSERMNIAIRSRSSCW